MSNEKKSAEQRNEEEVLSLDVREIAQFTEALVQRFLHGNLHELTSRIGPAAAAVQVIGLGVVLRKLLALAHPDQRVAVMAMIDAYGDVEGGAVRRRQDGEPATVFGQRVPDGGAQC